ncbi:hypothetical protein AHAS_Ahas09G0179700 [Arachis hypogaea]
MVLDLEVAIMKATNHDDDPAGEKYICEILNLISYSCGYIHACVRAMSKRLGKTREIFKYPKVQRITSKLLETLKEFVRNRTKRPKSPEKKEELSLTTCERGGTGTGYK